MENKKYLDKVIGSLVRGTKIDYDNNEIFSTSSLFSFPPSFFLPTFSNLTPHPPLYFVKYCMRQFGLISDEIEYVWEQYVEIINHKIENGE
jgi:hypothetical protein